MSEQFRPSAVHRLLLLLVTGAIRLCAALLRLCSRAAAEARRAAAVRASALLDALLGRRSVHLSRVPRHLSVAVLHVPAGADVDWHAMLTDWVAWCLVYGVEHFSMYDATNTAMFDDAAHRASLADRLCDTIAGRLRAAAPPHRSAAPAVRMRVGGAALVIPKGAKPAGDSAVLDIRVDMWSGRTHGRAAIVELVAQLAAEGVRPESVTRDFVDAELARRFSLAEPDLLVQVDPVLCGGSLSDCPPWHVRLAELYHLADARLDGVTEAQFVECLHAYASRQQRFGR